jgi:hypothetical protein
VVSVAVEAWFDAMSEHLVAATGRSDAFRETTYAPPE